MKKLIITFVVGLLVQPIVQAQGTLYLSNLTQPSASGEPVGNDSWLATSFSTGNNAGGYELNSVQLAMLNASGNPSGFTVMLYTLAGNFSASTYPGVALDTLDGSANPSTTGAYTYTPASSIILSPDTAYFIVMTAGTSVANGSYEWSLTDSSSHNSNGGLGAVGGIGVNQSSDGLSWTLTGGGAYPNFFYPQYAITATAVPEPGVLGLVGVGGLFFIRRRQKLQ